MDRGLRAVEDGETAVAGEDDAEEDDDVLSGVGGPSASRLLALSQQPKNSLWSL